MSRNILKPLAMVTQLGIRLITPILLCVIGGLYIDDRLGTGYLFTLILTVLGGATSIYELIKISQSYKD